MGKKKQAENTKERMVHIRLDSDIHRLLRVRTAEEDVSIQDWVAELIEAELKKTSPSSGRKP